MLQMKHLKNMNMLHCCFKTIIIYIVELYFPITVNKCRANVYGKDETNPTGVALLGCVSSIKLVDHFVNKLNLSGGGALSPTENKLTAH
jgi:hypothetical protein